MTTHVRDLQLIAGSTQSCAHAARTPHQGQATVTASDERGLVLDDDEQTLAQRAASCLLEPMVGDRVWFVDDADERYVTAVLRRAPGDGVARLRVDGDAELCGDGRLRVQFEALELHGQKQLHLHGDELRLRARRGQALVDECSLVLRELFAHAGHATVVGTIIELLADQLRSHSKTSVRVVEQLDQLRAGNIDHRASEVAELAGKHTLVHGIELVKADAAQIHLG